jgi:hypothetical protein
MDGGAPTSLRPGSQKPRCRGEFAFATDHDKVALPMQDPIAHAHRAVMDSARGALPFERFDRAAYPADLLEAARQLWLARRDNEFQSVIVFSQLTVWCSELGSDLDVLGSATRLIADEVRHVELCERFAAVLGGPTTARPLPARSGLSRQLPTLADEIERLILTAFCIGETVSVDLIRASQLAASDTLAQAVLTELLRDESFHRQFGWTFAARTIDRNDAAQVASIEAMLPAALAHYERVCVPAHLRVSGATPPRLDPPPRQAGEINLGFASDEANAAAFYGAMADEVLARFEELGVAANRAWALRPFSGEP